MKKEVSVYKQAVLDMCKRAGIKTPSGLIGRKVNIEFYDKISGSHQIFTTIQRVNIKSAYRLKDSIAEIVLYNEEEYGNIRYSLVYYLEEASWMFTKIKNDVRMGRYSTEIFFPKKWFIFNRLIPFQVQYLDGE